MAYFDAFLKIDGIDGESQDDKHKGEIDVLSFSWGATQPGVAAGQPASRTAKLQISDLSFLKKVDVATPKLMQGAAFGAVYPTATLIARKAGENQQEFLKVTLSEIIITSISVGGNGQTDTVPLEQVSLNFSKIDVAVYGQSAPQLY